MNPSIHFLGTTKYYLTGKGEVEGKHLCTILSLTENLHQLWPLTIDLSDCETRSQMGSWTRMLSQILYPIVTITSFRTSLLALGLSHGWAILVLTLTAVTAWPGRVQGVSGTDSVRKVFSAQCTVHIQGKQGQRGLMGEIYSRAEEALLLQHKTGKSRALLIRSTEGTEGGREKPSTGEGKQLAGNTGAAAANARASPATSSAATATATATTASTVTFFAALPRLSHVSAQLYNMAQSSLTIKCNFALGPVWLIQFFLFNWYNFSDILQFGHRKFGLLHFMNSFILEQHYSISRSLRPCQWTNWSCKWMVSCFLLSSSLPASSSSSLSSR